MTRRLLTAALTLSVAGGVYFAGAPAQASNMGFKLERDLDFRRNALNAPLTNMYIVAFPNFNGLGDVANQGHTTNSKCVGDVNGPTVGDDWINSSDAICDLWPARNASNPPSPATAGTFQITYYRRTDCVPVSQTANIVFGVPNFQTTGFFPPDDGDGDPSNNTDLWTDRAYQVNLAAQPGTTPRNRVIIVGSHDPAFTGQPIAASALCGPRAAQIDLLTVPYHTMLTNAIELVCGLEGSAWIDDGLNAAGAPPGGGSPTPTAGDGYPDSLDECDTSIFDGVHALIVNRWFNDPPPGINGALSCTVNNTFNFLNVTGCQGANNFDLTPGDGYQVNINRAHVATNFLSPHF